METRSLPIPTPRDPFSDRESTAPMRIAVAYQDTASLIKAVQFCDRIVHQHWEDIDIECTWWKLSFLRHPQIHSEAVDAAGNADLILFSLPTAEALGAAAQEWIEDWLERRHFRPGALVSLVPEDSGRAEGSAAQAYLQEIARRAGMDFFPQHLSTLERPDNIIEDMRFTASLVDSLPEDDTTPRWGINE